VGSPLFLLRDDPQFFIAFVVAVVIGITVHEFSHAAAATAQGDLTAKSQGRLTLNPASHLDPLGTIFLIIAGFGWGKPTPFDPQRLRSRRVGVVLVALAGPTSNVVVAILAAIALRLTDPTYFELGSSGFTSNLLYALVYLNVVLAVFNLLPIPPLDGSRLLSTLHPLLPRPLRDLPAARAAAARPEPLRQAVRAHHRLHPPPGRLLATAPQARRP
jgi:Zn-dependent protease